MSDEQTEELLEEILENQLSDSSEQDKADAVSYLVFKAGEMDYAVNSTEVREILRNNEVYPNL
ncbi:MAG: hypothetical protein IKI40_04020 [Treponema sp.]|nr:hypothetical protein [Treponema sp.]